MPCSPKLGRVHYRTQSTDWLRPFGLGRVRLAVRWFPCRSPTLSGTFADMSNDQPVQAWRVFSGFCSQTIFEFDRNQLLFRPHALAFRASMTNPQPAY